MRGTIYLIKIQNEKVVPAICLDDSQDDILFAQLRKANDEDIFNTQDRAVMEKYNKSRPERDQIKIRKKYEINSVFIGQPKGLTSKSVVMVKRLHRVKESEIIKELAHVQEEKVIECKELIKQVVKIDKLQKELQILKKKMLYASINNEKPSEYEKRADAIKAQIGYPLPKKKEGKPYLNYREVPNKSHIKIFPGGRN